MGDGGRSRWTSGGEGMFDMIERASKACIALSGLLERQSIFLDVVTYRSTFKDSPSALVGTFG